MKRLDVSQNSISDIGARALCKLLLRDNCVLDELNVGDNEIYSTGGEFFAKVGGIDSGHTIHIAHDPSVI